MNKYFLMLAAAGLIASAPAYYAFQAQAEETHSEEAAAPAEEATTDEAAPADEHGAETETHDATHAEEGAAK